jgi:hypothetical protein
VVGELVQERLNATAAKAELERVVGELVQERLNATAEVELRAKVSLFDLLTQTHHNICCHTGGRAGAGEVELCRREDRTRTGCG